MWAACYANYVSYATLANRPGSGPHPPTCVPTSIYRRGGSRNSLGGVGQGQDVNYCLVEEAAGVAKFPYLPTSPNVRRASRLLANFTLEVLTSSAWSLLWRV